MEKITDLVKELKGRISSPLFSSFIIAWLTFNWKIPIGLFFLNNNDLLNESYSSYFSLISSETSKPNSLKYPIIISLIYTLGYPFVKAFILVFNSAVESLGSLGIKRFSSFGMISISKYFLLRDTYEERSKLLDKTMQEEKKFLQLNETLKNDLLKEQIARNRLENEMQKIDYFNSSKCLNGEWILSIDNVTSKETQNLLISDGTVSEIWNEIRDKKVIGKIENFHFNLITNEILFYLNTKQIYNSVNESHFFILTFNGEKNNLSNLLGYLDNKKHIQLTKID